MFGLKTVHMIAVGIKCSEKVIFVQKYSFGKMSITNFIKKSTWYITAQSCNFEPNCGYWNCCYFKQFGCYIIISLPELKSILTIEKRNKLQNTPWMA